MVCSHLKQGHLDLLWMISLLPFRWISTPTSVFSEELEEARCADGGGLIISRETNNSYLKDHT
jgi:hypothetical protein